MALLANMVLNAMYPFRIRGGFQADARSVWGRADRRNLFVGSGGVNARSGVPNGHLHPSSWVLPQKPGGMSSREGLDGAGALTAAGAMGVNGTATLAGAGALTGTAELVVSGSAALAGSGSLTGTVLAALVGAADLSGAGALTGTLTAVGFPTANLSGAGAVGATLTATGTLAADITVTGEALSTANVGSAVWGSDSGDGTYTYSQVLRIVAAVVAGKASGGPGSPVFRNLADSSNIVSGTADGSGNRTAATYTP